MSQPAFSKGILQLDAEAEVRRIVAFLRKSARECLRRGAVIALSGGIDSSTVGALCVEAFGKDRCFGLSLPERDSLDETPDLSRGIIEHLGIASETVNLTPILESVGCYSRRDEAIRQVLPEYGSGWKSKIVLPTVTDNDQYRIFSVVAQDPQGRMHTRRLSQEAYLGILAATNFKQRTRKMHEYYWADRLNYLVAGTPNLLEYDQGFFVKLGDGAADVKPIGHLYKSQVYQIAAQLGVPDEILNRPPTTDTYSLPQSQEEFYFSVPYQEMDLCLYARNHGVPAEEVARCLGWEAEQVERVFTDIDHKRKTTRYLHLPPMMIELGANETPGLDKTHA